MLSADKVKVFKKNNSGDVVGVVRTMFPGIEIETILFKKKGNK